MKRIYNKPKTTIVNIKLNDVVLLGTSDTTEANGSSGEEIKGRRYFNSSSQEHDSSLNALW